MAVYVDDMYKSPLGQFGRMKMSHMMADSTEELLAMCDKIRVHRKWIQKKGTIHEHFDISISKRQLAILHGAIEVPTMVLCEWSVSGRNYLLTEKLPPREEGQV